MWRILKYPYRSKHLNPRTARRIGLCFSSSKQGRIPLLSGTIWTPPKPCTYLEALHGIPTMKIGRTYQKFGCCWTGQKDALNGIEYTIRRSPRFCLSERLGDLQIRSSHWKGVDEVPITGESLLGGATLDWSSAPRERTDSSRSRWQQ